MDERHSPATLPKEIFESAAGFHSLDSSSVPVPGQATGTSVRTAFQVAADAGFSSGNTTQSPTVARLSSSCRAIAVHMPSRRRHRANIITRHIN